MNSSRLGQRCRGVPGRVPDQPPAQPGGGVDGASGADGQVVGVPGDRDDVAAGDRETLLAAPVGLGASASQTSGLWGGDGEPGAGVTGPAIPPPLLLWTPPLPGTLAQGAGTIDPAAPPELGHPGFVDAGVLAPHAVSVTARTSAALSASSNSDMPQDQDLRAPQKLPPAMTPRPLPDASHPAKSMIGRIALQRK
jgi:hypothetical protein